MVLGLLIDYSLKASFWVCQKTYDGAVYMYYGKQETNEEKILRELKELKSENSELRDQLQLLLVNSSETKKEKVENYEDHKVEVEENHENHKVEVEENFITEKAEVEEDLSTTKNIVDLNEEESEDIHLDLLILHNLCQ